MLVYGLINPIGVVPVYLSLVRRVSPEHAHRIILVVAGAVAGRGHAQAGISAHAAPGHDRNQCSDALDGPHRRLCHGTTYTIFTEGSIADLST